MGSAAYSYICLVCTVRCLSQWTEIKDQPWRQLPALVRLSFLRLLPGSLVGETRGQYNRVWSEGRRAHETPSSTWEIITCSCLLFITSLKSRVHHSGVIISRSTMIRSGSEKLASVGVPMQGGSSKDAAGRCF